MGTVLSFASQDRKDAVSDERRSDGTLVKKSSVIVSAVAVKKLVASSKKKKVAPKPKSPAVQKTSSTTNHQLNNDNNKKPQLNTDNNNKKAPQQLSVPAADPSQKLRSETPVFLQASPIHLQVTPSRLQVPARGGKLSTVKKERRLGSPRHVIIQASTGELLHCLGDFIRRRCCRLKSVGADLVILWFRNVDRSLLLQGWQDCSFITPANLVFVYMLCKDAVQDDIPSTADLQGTFLSILYLAYSYMGHEISYPLYPFMVPANRHVFWDRALQIIDLMSAKMLLLNSDPHFFTEMFQELKEEGEADPSVDR